jgi:hypothetical protein
MSLHTSWTKYNIPQADSGYRYFKAHKIMSSSPTYGKEVSPSLTIILLPQ